MNDLETTRKVWAIKVLIEATVEQADRAVEAIASALCPDESHPGYCPTPWSTIRCTLDDLDADERARWTDTFSEDRQRARDVGESGA